MHNLVRASAAVLIACFVSASSACAQTLMRPETRPEFQGRSPTAGFQTVHALTNDRQVVDLYVKPNQDIRLPTGRPWIEYVARRWTGNSDEAGLVSWTNSRECPALYNTLVWLTTLVAPRVEIAGITPSEADPAGRRPVTIVADGLVTTVWGHGTQPDYVAHTRVEITSNGGLIAEFGRAATENLKSCWTDAEPAF